jgi:hypothetical protein
MISLLIRIEDVNRRQAAAEPVFYYIRAEKRAVPIILPAIYSILGHASYRTTRHVHFAKKMTYPEFRRAA